MDNKERKISAIRKNESYSQKVYLQLKELILTNELKPGEILNERELAAQLEVSRTPVRDALRMLEQEEWVVRRGKITAVSNLTWSVILELTEVRATIELLSYDLAVPKITDKDIEVFQKIVDEMHAMAKTAEGWTYYDLMKKDLEFHGYLAEITKNTYVKNFMSSLMDHLVRTSVLSMEYGDMPPEQYACRHNEILDCFKKKDYVEGRKKMVEHIEVWKGHLNNIPEIVRVSAEHNIPLEL